MEQDYYERSFSPQRPRSQLSSEYSGASTAHPVEWQDDWISREEEFRDTINALQTEQERIQKKTFTNWINSHVEHVRPDRKLFVLNLENCVFKQHRDHWIVKDLFTDLKDGRILLALLEVITGDYLPCETFRHYTRAHYLSNVERALDYLRHRHIKLVNINSTDVVDGNETVILGLIWTIILNFQIDQDLAHLRENFLISPIPSGARSASYEARSRSVSPSPTKKPRLAARGRFQAGAFKAMLKWCQKEISDRYGVPITNLSTSWKDGMAFLGLDKVLDPNLVNLSDFRHATAAERMNTAFDIAHERLGISKLLDVADIDVDRPDERSIMTYIAQFIKRFPEAKRSRQKTLMDNLPDVEAMEASEKAEFERIRDWCNDVLTVLKCLELSDEKPFEAYEEYKKFNRNFRINMSVYTRLKERFEEGRTIHIAEQNITDLDSLWARLIAEKQAWHHHLFSNNSVQDLTKNESELDQRVLLPPQRVTHYSKVNLEFRVQKHEDTHLRLTHLRDELNGWLVREYPSQPFAFHDLPNELDYLISDLERRLLEGRCKLLTKRQLTVVDEWERRVDRWEELLRTPGSSLERLAYEFELHVVQERIFDKFLELSKSLQRCLEVLQESPDADKHQRAEFLSSAVNSNRRWKRIGERLYEIREQLRQQQTAMRQKGQKVDLEYQAKELPTLSLSPTSPISPPAYLKSEQWQLYLQRVAAFARWLDRMERDFESIDREEVNRVEYQQSLQRFRALCNEVVDHKTDGQEIIDTFYQCSATLPPTVVTEEQRKINRLIRRYDALIPSLEIVRSEVERNVHAHQITSTHKETVQLVPEHPETAREQVHVRVVTPAGGALSPTISVGTSGYHTPEFENALLRRSEPTTPSSFNRSPPLAYGISSQSSVNEGSPVEPVSVRDIEEDARRSVSAASPRGVEADKSPTDDTRIFVRDVPVMEESSSSAGPSRPRVMFSKSERSVDVSSDEESAKRIRSGRDYYPRGDEMEVVEETSRTYRLGKTAGEPEGSKFSALRAAFEKKGPDVPPKPSPGKKGSVYEALRRKSVESSSSDDERSETSPSTGRKKHRKAHSTESYDTSTFVRAFEEPARGRQRPTGIVFDSNVSDADIERVMRDTPTTPPSVAEKPKYLRNVKTTTLVTSTETKTVKTVRTKSPHRVEDVPYVGSGRLVGKIKHPAVFTETSSTPATPATESSTETFVRRSSDEPFEGRVRSQLDEIRRRQEAAESPTSPRTPESESAPRLSDTKKSPFGFLKKKYTKTESEETTQTTKRVIVAPIVPSKRSNRVEPVSGSEFPRSPVREEATRTFVTEPTRVDPTQAFVVESETVQTRDVEPKFTEEMMISPLRSGRTETHVRDVPPLSPQPAQIDSTQTFVRTAEYISPSTESFSESVLRSIRRTSDTGSEPGVVRIGPYGAERVTEMESPKQVNRIKDLFERGSTDPSLFAQVSETETVVRTHEPVLEDVRDFHISRRSPVQLSEEKVEAWTEQPEVPQRPVSERVRSFEEIFAPLDNVTPRFDEQLESRTVVRDVQPVREIEKEESEISSTSDQAKPKKHSIFAGIFRSKKVAPEENVTTVKVKKEVTETHTIVREEKPVVETVDVGPARARPDRVPHGSGSSDFDIDEEAFRVSSDTRETQFGTLPADVDEFLKPSAEHLRETVTKARSEERMDFEPEKTQTFVRESTVYPAELPADVREFLGPVPEKRTYVTAEEFVTETHEEVKRSRGVKDLVSAYEDGANREVVLEEKVKSEEVPEIRVREAEELTEPRVRPSVVPHFTGLSDHSLEKHAPEVEIIETVTDVREVEPELAPTKPVRTPSPVITEERYEQIVEKRKISSSKKPELEPVTVVRRAASPRFDEREYLDESVEKTNTQKTMTPRERPGKVVHNVGWSDQAVAQFAEIAEPVPEPMEEDLQERVEQSETKKEPRGLVVVHEETKTDVHHAPREKPVVPSRKIRDEERIVTAVTETEVITRQRPGPVPHRHGAGDLEYHSELASRIPAEIVTRPPAESSERIEEVVQRVTRDEPVVDVIQETRTQVREIVSEKPIVQRELARDSFGVESGPKKYEVDVIPGEILPVAEREVILFIPGTRETTTFIRPLMDEDVRIVEPIVRKETIEETVEKWTIEEPAEVQLVSRSRTWEAVRHATGLPDREVEFQSTVVRETVIVGEVVTEDFDVLNGPERFVPQLISAERRPSLRQREILLHERPRVRDVVENHFDVYDGVPQTRPYIVPGEILPSAVRGTLELIPAVHREKPVMIEALDQKQVRIVPPVLRDTFDVSSGPERTIPSVIPAEVLPTATRESLELIREVRETPEFVHPLEDSDIRTVQPVLQHDFDVEQGAETVTSQAIAAEILPTAVQESIELIRADRETPVYVSPVEATDLRVVSPVLQEDFNVVSASETITPRLIPAEILAVAVPENFDVVSAPEMITPRSIPAEIIVEAVREQMELIPASQREIPVFIQPAVQKDLLTIQPVIRESFDVASGSTSVTPQLIHAEILTTATRELMELMPAAEREVPVLVQPVTEVITIQPVIRERFDVASGSKSITPQIIPAETITIATRERMELIPASDREIPVFIQSVSEKDVVTIQPVLRESFDVASGPHTFSSALIPAEVLITATLERMKLLPAVREVPTFVQPIGKADSMIVQPVVRENMEVQGGPEKYVPLIVPAEDVPVVHKASEVVVIEREKHPTREEQIREERTEISTTMSVRDRPSPVSHRHGYSDTDIEVLSDFPLGSTEQFHETIRHVERGEPVVDVVMETAEPVSVDDVILEETTTVVREDAKKRPTTTVVKDESVTSEYRPRTSSRGVRPDDIVVHHEEVTLNRPVTPSAPYSPFTPAAVHTIEEERTTTFVRPNVIKFEDTKETKAEAKLRAKAEKINHFIPMSDRGFESKLFARGARGAERREKIFQAETEAASVSKKVRVFSDMGGIEFGRAAEERVEELQSRTSDTTTTPSLYGSRTSLAEKESVKEKVERKKSGGILGFFNKGESKEETRERTKPVTILESGGFKEGAIQMEKVTRVRPTLRQSSSRLSSRDYSRSNSQEVTEEDVTSQRPESREQEVLQETVSQEQPDRDAVLVRAACPEGQEEYVSAPFERPSWNVYHRVGPRDEEMGAFQAGMSTDDEFEQYAESVTSEVLADAQREVTDEYPVADVEVTKEGRQRRGRTPTEIYEEETVTRTVTPREVTPAVEVTDLDDLRVPHRTYLGDAEMAALENVRRKDRSVSPKPVVTKTKFEAVHVDVIPDAKKIKSEEVLRTRLPSEVRAETPTEERYEEYVTAHKPKRTPSPQEEAAVLEEQTREERRREASNLPRRFGPIDDMIEPVPVAFSESPGVTATPPPVAPRRPKERSVERLEEIVSKAYVPSPARTAESPKRSESPVEYVLRAGFSDRDVENLVRRLESEQEREAERVELERTRSSEELSETRRRDRVSPSDIGVKIGISSLRASEIDEESVSTRRVKADQSAKDFKFQSHHTGMADRDMEGVMSRMRVREEEIPRDVEREIDEETVRVEEVKRQVPVAPIRQVETSEELAGRVVSTKKPFGEESISEQVVRTKSPNGTAEEEFLASHGAGTFVRRSSEVEEALVGVVSARPRPDVIPHHVSYSDRNLEEESLAFRPDLVISVSETDLAPQRRKSVPPQPSSEVNEGQTQQFPWQETVVREAETVSRVPEAEQPSTSRVPEETARTVEESSSTVVTTSTESGKKKGGFFGIFGSKKEQKESKTSRTEEAVPTQTFVSEIGEEQVRTRRISREPKDTVPDLIYGPKEPKPIVSERLEEQTVLHTTEDSERSGEEYPIYHHPGFADRDVEPWLDRFIRIPYEVEEAPDIQIIPVTETVVAPPVEEQLEEEWRTSTTVAGYPADEEKLSRSSSRTSAPLPSFIPFEREKSPSQSQRSKTRKEKSIVTTTSRRSTPSPAASSKSSKSSEMEIRGRTKSPAVSVEKLEGSSSTKKTKKGTQKIKSIVVTMEKRLSSAAGDTRAHEELFEDILYTRPASRKDTPEDIARSRSPDIAERTTTIVRDVSESFEPKTPEPTREIFGESVERVVTESPDEIRGVGYAERYVEPVDRRTSLELLPPAPTVVREIQPTVSETTETFARETVTVEEVPEQTPAVVKTAEPKMQLDRKTSLEFPAVRRVRVPGESTEENLEEEVVTTDLRERPERIIHNVGLSNRQFEDERRTSLEFLPDLPTVTRVREAESVVTEEIPSEPEPPRFEPDRRSSLEFSKDRPVRLPGTKPAEETIQETVEVITETRTRVIYETPLADRDYERERRTSLEFLPEPQGERRVVETVRIEEIPEETETVVRSAVPEVEPDRRTSLEFSRFRPARVPGERHSLKETVEEEMMITEQRERPERIIHNVGLSDRHFEDDRRTSLEFLPPLPPTRVRDDNMEVLQEETGGVTSEPAPQFEPDRRTSLEFVTHQPVRQPRTEQTEETIEEHVETITTEPRTRQIHNVQLADRGYDAERRTSLEFLPPVSTTHVTTYGPEEVTLEEVSREIEDLAEETAFEPDRRTSLEFSRQRPVHIRHVAHPVTENIVEEVTTEELPGRVRVVHNVPFSDRDFETDRRTSLEFLPDVPVVKSKYESLSEFIVEVPETQTFIRMSEVVSTSGEPLFEQDRRTSLEFQRERVEPVKTVTIVRPEPVEEEQSTESVQREETLVEPRERPGKLVHRVGVSDDRFDDIFLEPSETESTGVIYEEIPEDTTTVVRNVVEEPVYATVQKSPKQPTVRKESVTTTVTRTETSEEKPAKEKKKSAFLGLFKSGKDKSSKAETSETVTRVRTVETERRLESTEQPAFVRSVSSSTASVTTQEFEPEPVLITRDRPEAVLHRPGLSDQQIVETAPVSVIPVAEHETVRFEREEREALPTIVREEETVVVREIHRPAAVTEETEIRTVKPAVRPRTHSRDRLEVAETVEVVPVEVQAPATPRDRPDPVEHRGRFSDSEVEDAAVKLLPEARVEAVIERVSEMVTRREEPAPVTEPFVREPEPSVEIVKTETFVRESAPAIERNITESETVKAERKKSKGIFGIFKRKSSKGSESVSETVVSETTIPEPVVERAFVRSEDVETTPTVARDFHEDYIPERRVEPEPVSTGRDRPEPIAHRTGFPDVDISDAVVETFPQTEVRETESVVRSEIEKHRPVSPVRRISLEEETVERVRTSESVSEGVVEIEKLKPEKTKKGGIFGIFKSKKELKTKEETSAESVTKVREVAPVAIVRTEERIEKLPVQRVVEEPLVPRRRPEDIEHRTGISDVYVGDRVPEEDVDEEYETVVVEGKSQRVKKPQTVENFESSVHTTQVLSRVKETPFVDERAVSTLHPTKTIVRDAEDVDIVTIREIEVPKQYPEELVPFSRPDAVHHRTGVSDDYIEHFAEISGEHVDEEYETILVEGKNQRVKKPKSVEQLSESTSSYVRETLPSPKQAVHKRKEETVTVVEPVRTETHVRELEPEPLEVTDVRQTEWELPARERPESVSHREKVDDVYVERLAVLHEAVQTNTSEFVQEQVETVTHVTPTPEKPPKEKFRESDITTIERVHPWVFRPIHVHEEFAEVKTRPVSSELVEETVQTTTYVTPVPEKARKEAPPSYQEALAPRSRPEKVHHRAGVSDLFVSDRVPKDVEEVGEQYETVIVEGKSQRVKKPKAVEQFSTSSYVTETLPPPKVATRIQKEETVAVTELPPSPKFEARVVMEDVPVVIQRPEPELLPRTRPERIQHRDRVDDYDVEMLVGRWEAEHQPSNVEVLDESVRKSMTTKTFVTTDISAVEKAHPEIFHPVAVQRDVPVRKEKVETREEFKEAVVTRETKPKPPVPARSASRERVQVTETVVVPVSVDMTPRERPAKTVHRTGVADSTLEEYYVKNAEHYEEPVRIVEILNDQVEAFPRPHVVTVQTEVPTTTVIEIENVRPRDRPEFVDVTTEYVQSAERPLKPRTEEHEHVTVSAQQVKTPTVRFGVSESSRIIKDHAAVEMGTVVTSARVLSPQEEEHVTVREVTYPGKQQPKSGILKPAKVVVVTQPEPQLEVEVVSEPRIRPGRVHHFVGVRDDYVSDNLDVFRETVAHSVTPTKKAKKVVVTSSSESSVDSSEEEEQVTVRKARPIAPVAIKEAESSEEEFSRSHSERVRRVHLQETPRRSTPLAEEYGETVYHHEQPKLTETIIREPEREPTIVKVEFQELPGRERPGRVEHFVGQTDARLEEWFLENEPERVPVVVPVETREHLAQEIIVTETASIEKMKPKPALRKTKSQELLEQTGTETVVTEAVTVTERTRKSSASSTSSSERERQIKRSAIKTKKEKEEPITVVRSAESVEVREESSLKERLEEERIIRERELERERRERDLELERERQRVKSQTITPTSITSSEAVSSLTGTRSKTPDSKSKNVRVTKTKVPKAGSSETKEFIYEDILYTKPAKGNRSKTPDTALRGSTIATTRVASTSPEIVDVRSKTMDFWERAPEQTATTTETFVRNAPLIEREESAEVVHQAKEKSGKKVMKKKRSDGSRRSSTSTSSREDVEEISSVTKAKLMSPTPEPRDEVQMVLAGMQHHPDYEEETTTIRVHDISPEPPRVLSPTILHKVSPGDLELESYIVRHEEFEPVQPVHLESEYVHEIHRDSPRTIRHGEESVVYTKVVSTKTETHVRSSRNVTSESSTTEEEDQQGNRVRVRRKRRPRKSAEEREHERVVTYQTVEQGKPVAGHRDSETGVTLIERTKTDQLPSYISFGTLEPESPQRSLYRGQDEHEEFYRDRSMSPWSRDKILHRAGPKDFNIEYYDLPFEEPSKPPRRDKETPESFYYGENTENVEEGVFREVSRKRKTPVVSEIETTETIVRNVGEPERSLEREREIRQLSPESESSISIVTERERKPVSPSKSATHIREGTAEARLAPARVRPQEAEDFRGSSTSPRSRNGEFLEEHVDVYRVKFSKDLEDRRSKTPELGKTTRVREMKVSTLPRSGRSSASSPAPLGLPYPPTHRLGREEVMTPENEDISMYVRDIPEGERLDTLSPLKEGPSTGKELERTRIRTRVIATADSVEDDMVVADVRRVTPEVGNMEFWTTSGGSSEGGLDNERAIDVEKPDYQKTRTALRESSISDTATYMEIPDTRTQVRETQVMTRPAEPATLPVSSRASLRRSRSHEQPVYAKVQKKRKGGYSETLEEDVFYWKILKRKNRKSYSEERLRARSPENVLDADERMILARSVSPFSEEGDVEKKTRKQKSEIVTKRKGRPPMRFDSGDMSAQQEFGSSPGLDDSGMYSIDGREKYNVDLRLTANLAEPEQPSSLRRNQQTRIQSRHLLSVSQDSSTPMHVRSFSPSSNEPLSGRESPYDTAESSSDHYDERSSSKTERAERTSRIRKGLLADVESETTLRSAHDDVDRRYRAAMREPLPEPHSCYPVYEKLQRVVHENLLEFEELILDPDCQYIDQETLAVERQRFTGLLDSLVRINKDLDRLDDLYRAMINVESEDVVVEVESRQRELNRLYMGLLSQLKSILRRIKHLQMLLDEYRRRRLHFKVQLLEELTYFRTRENMSEEDQRERVNRLLEEVLILRSSTYNMFVRSTPEFAARLEMELHEILMLLRTELRVPADLDNYYGSLIQLLLTGRYSVEFDATEQKLILSSDEITSEIPTSTSRFRNPTVWSVLRRALPMQALALILLGFASLIPMTDDEFSCLFSNYFASSFNPALKFTGPPPI